MGRRRSKWVGRAVFLIPVGAVILLALFGLLSSALTGPGTLVVEAQTTSGTKTQFVAVSATVSGTTKATPFNLSVSAGTYTVTYSSLKWYTTPPPRLVTVEGGKVAYAIGVYAPVPVEIVVSQAGPNSTTATAEHGVTPIVWVNTTGQVIQLDSAAFSEVIPPNGNYTGVFPEAGVQIVRILPTSYTVTFTVD